MRAVGRSPRGGSRFQNNIRENPTIKACCFSALCNVAILTKNSPLISTLVREQRHRSDRSQSAKMKQVQNCATSSTSFESLDSTRPGLNGHGVTSPAITCGTTILSRIQKRPLKGFKYVDLSLITFWLSLKVTSKLEIVKRRKDHPQHRLRSTRNCRHRCLKSTIILVRRHCGTYEVAEPKMKSFADTLGRRFAVSETMWNGHLLAMRIIEKVRPYFVCVLFPSSFITSRCFLAITFSPSRSATPFINRRNRNIKGLYKIDTIISKRW